MIWVRTLSNTWWQNLVLPQIRIKFEQIRANFFKSLAPPAPTHSPPSLEPEENVQIDWEESPPWGRARAHAARGTTVVEDEGDAEAGPAPRRPFPLALLL